MSSNLNKVLADLFNKNKSILTDHLFKSFRKDVDGYIIVDPNILYQTDSEKDFLIKKLKKTRDALMSGIVREKYNPLISMLSDGIKVGLKGNDIGTY